jgi:CTP:phosphocholine cytidylyltransferase-like protein
VASAEWTVMHNLNKYCSVVVVDSTNQIVFPEIVYVDKNTVKIISTGAFSG